MKQFNNKYLKVPLLYSGSGGGFERYWRQVSYISNDNLTYAMLPDTYPLWDKVPCCIELECNLNKITSGKKTLWGTATWTNNVLALNYNADTSSLYLSIGNNNRNEHEIILEERNKIKFYLNSNVSSESSTNYLSFNDNIIDTNFTAKVSNHEIFLFKSNGVHVIGNFGTAKFDIFALNMQLLGINYNYIPAICIKAYDNILLNTVALVDFANEKVIKAASGNFVANE